MAVYKDLKRNTWYFRIYVDDETGVKKQKTRSGFKTKLAAKHAESEFLLNYNILNDNNDILFIDLYYEYIKYKKQNLKYQSFRTYKSKIEKHILPFFKDYKINNIKSNDYIEWKEYIINKNFSYKYNCSLHICMVNILNFAYKFYNLNENVASKVGNFSKRNYFPKVNFWTFNEFNQFINNVDDKVYYSLFTILYYTGMRLGECLALNWNDIKDNCIYVNKNLIRKNINNPIFNTPKTPSSVRIIKIDKYTLNVLNDLKDFYKKSIGFDNKWFVFGGLNPLATTTIERRKNYYCKISNVKQIKIHEFRHSHATLLISKGVPISVISKRLGHSDMSTTLKIYSHLIPEDEDKAVNMLDKIREF